MYSIFLTVSCTGTIIYQDEEFYLKMLSKLKEFYMDHLLVQILLINVQINKLRNYRYNHVQYNNLNNIFARKLVYCAKIYFS
jgi:hypothetical protein